jgi:hypothetical protein
MYSLLVDTLSIAQCLQGETLLHTLSAVTKRASVKLFTYTIDRGLTGPDAELRINF